METNTCNSHDRRVTLTNAAEPSPISGPEPCRCGFDRCADRVDDADQCYSHVHNYLLQLAAFPFHASERRIFSRGGSSARLWQRQSPRTKHGLAWPINRCGGSAIGCVATIRSYTRKSRVDSGRWPVGAHRYPADGIVAADGPVAGAVAGIVVVDVVVASGNTVSFTSATAGKFRPSRSPPHVSYPSTVIVMPSP